MRRIHAVLNQFDDRDDQVCGVIPVEEIIDIGAVMSLDTTVYLFAEGREQYDRAFGHAVFGLLGELEYIQFAYAIHR